MCHRVMASLSEGYFRFRKSGVPNGGHYPMAELKTVVLRFTSPSTMKACDRLLTNDGYWLLVPQKKKTDF